jgi:hypothetical protein
MSNNNDHLMDQGAYRSRNPQIYTTPFDDPSPYAPNKFTPGEYYIGDPCYVLSHVWDALCTAMFASTPGGYDGVYTLANYGKVAIAGTAYGDGRYYASNGASLGVDAGCLSIVPLHVVAKMGNISMDDARALARKMGCLHAFQQDAFTCEADGGVMRFGDVYINTRGDEDEDDEDDDDNY